MSVISVRLPDNLLKDIDKYAHLRHISKAEYIRKAVEKLRSEDLAKERHKKLMALSKRVRKESMQVNQEFEEIDHDPEE